MLGFFDAGVSVAYHVVTGFTHVLAPLLGAGAGAAVAIVAFTVAVRLLLVPLSYVALRGQAVQARLQPDIRELRRRYAGQPDRLQRELAALYQREGSGLLAGCLPLLAQLPFFSLMYRLFRSASVGGQPNLLLAHRLLGAPLGGHWLGGTGPFSGRGLVFLGLFALLGAVGWASARLARVTQPEPGPAPVPPEKLSTAVAKVVPYTTVVIAMFVPLAAALYLLTTTAWTVAERAALRHRAHQAAGRAARNKRTWGRSPAIARATAEISHLHEM